MILKKVSILLLFLVLYTAGFTQEENRIHESFNQYKNAILNNNGEEAASYVDSVTIAYYSHMLKKIIFADSLTVDSLNPLDKLIVFRIRLKVSKKEIVSMDGRGLLIYAINNGLVGKQSVEKTTIGEINITGDSAKGQFVANGQITPYYFDFHKEKDVWKIDLTSIFYVGLAAFDKMIADSEQPENEFLLRIVEMMTGKKPGIKIWKPLKN